MFALLSGKTTKIHTIKSGVLLLSGKTTKNNTIKGFFLFYGVQFVHFVQLPNRAGFLFLCSPISLFLPGHGCRVSVFQLPNRTNFPFLFLRFKILFVLLQCNTNGQKPPNQKNIIQVRILSAIPFVLQLSGGW